MARFRIRLGLGREPGALRRSGAVAEVQAGSRVSAAVRTAVTELLRVAGNDPELSADQCVLVQTTTHVLEAETAKKRWNKERLRDLLADISRFAGTARATGDAVQAVRDSLSPVLQ